MSSRSGRCVFGVVRQLKAERAGELAAKRFWAAGGDPGASGIEPPAKRF